MTDDDGADGERTIIRPRPRPAARALPSTSLGHTLPVGTRLYDYEITGLIGEGGFGIVYHATDHSLQRHVAIKEYMPATMVSRQAGSSAIVVKSERMVDTFKAGLKSFVNEARLLARFDHPSLLKVYRFWEENGTAYMVMPYYEGPTLKDALAALGRPPTEGELRAWLDPLLDALAVLHHAQCYHRDIAPDNILLTSGGPLLLDFGAARRVIGDMTHALTVMLKPGYAPIEQYGDVASMSQGAWTDFYALASVVHYAITGRPPVSSVERLMDDRLEPLARVAAGRYSAEFLAGIDRALAVRPQDRPQNDAQFRAALGDAPRDPGPSTRGGLYMTGPGALSGTTSPLPATSAATSPATQPAFPATQHHVYATVPGTLTPELTTQLQPAPAPAPRPPAPRVPQASTVPPTTAATATPPVAAPAAAPTRGALVIGAVVVLLLVVGAGVSWWTNRVTPVVEAGAAPAVVPPTATVTAPPTATVVAPAATPIVTPTATPAVAPTVSAAATSPAASGPAPSLTPATTAARPARRTTERSATTGVPNATYGDSTASPAPSPTRAPMSARCSDILQKASLEALSSDEAAYLRRHCN